MTGSVPIDRLTRALETDPRFCAAVLFGSAARDALRAGSDVDIAVMYADDTARKSVEKDILTVLGTLGMVARRDVHLVDLERADPGLRRTLLASGRVLFDHAGGRFSRLHEKTLLEYFDWEYARSMIDAAHRRRLEAAGD